MPENYGALGAFNEQGQLNIPTQAAADYIAKQGQVTASQPQDDSWLSAVLSMNQKLGSGIIDVGQGLVHGATVGAANINKLIPGATWLGRQADDALRYVGVDPVVPEPKSTAGGLASGVGQALPGIIPAVKILKAAGYAPIAADLLGGLIGDFAASSKKDAKGITDLIGMIPGESSKEVSKALNDFIKSDNASSFEDLKARMFAALPGVVFTPVVNGLVRYAMKFKNNLATDNFTGTLRRPPVEEEAIPIGFTPDQPKQLGALPKPPEAEPIAVPAIDLSPEGFFSAMSRAVDALPMEKGGGAQMRAMIAKGEGVKAEEMAWTGLDDFLAGKKSVTKQEVRDFVDANQVQVEEVVRADEGITQNVSYLRRRYEMMVEGSGDYADLPPSLREERAEKMLADIEAMEADNVAGPTKFGEYTLPGGENYREVVLTLPETRSTISNSELARLDELADKRIANSLDGLTDAERDEYISLVGKREDKGQFREGHFDEPNVLAHIRLNDRTGPNGEKILFVEEIQSDWHQKGRKQGYRRDIKDLTTEERRAHSRMIALEEIGPKVTDAQNAEYKQLTEKHGVRSSDDLLGGRNAVPDAPLKKTWQEASLRRVIRMAAEEGYDSVAWTPGKVQAERYDLSKQISEIHLSGTDFRAYGLDGEAVIGRTGVKPEDLPELIGKEAADRLLSQEAKGGLRSLTGEQLEIGGEGMKGFYDKELVNYAKKFGKKFDAKVGVTKIARDYPEMADDLKLLDDLGVEATGSPHHEVWTIPITPKMRESVMKKGVPLFGVAGLAATAGMQGQDRNGL